MSDASPRTCAWCTEPIPPRSPTGKRKKPSKFCSKRCRQSSHRFGTASPSLGPEPLGRARRFAYADPPYPGMSARYYGDHQDFAGEVDHASLLEQLVDEYPDGWALSTSSKTLKHVLELCPTDARVGAWVHPAPPGYTTFARVAWEPVIFYGGRPRPPGAPLLLDWVYAPALKWATYPGGVIGMKPPAFSWWMFDCLGAQAHDELDDLFPGSSAVTRAWRRYTGQDPAAGRPAVRRVPPGDQRHVGGSMTHPQFCGDVLDRRYPCVRWSLSVSVRLEGHKRTPRRDQQSPGARPPRRPSMTAGTVQPTQAPFESPITPTIEPLGPCPHCGGSRVRCCEFGADPPERSLQQRLDALDHANEIRLYRAQLKKDVKCGERVVGEILLAPEDELATMKVLQLLVAMPKIGRIKANKMLTRMRISPSKTVGGLSERQRCELVSLLPRRLAR